VHGRACYRLSSMQTSLLLCALCVGALAGTTDTNRTRTVAQRLEPARLQAVHDWRLKLAQERRPVPNHGLYEDFRAVFHRLAPDTRGAAGDRAALVAAARKAGARIVFVGTRGGAVTKAPRGGPEDVLVLPCAETDRGLICFPANTKAKGPLSRELKFLARPAADRDSATEGLSGMVICDGPTEASHNQELRAWLTAAAKDTKRWRELLQDFHLFPDEFYAAGIAPRPETLVRWDQENRQRPFPGLGVNDAPQTNRIKGVTFDPRDAAWRHLSTHILAQELSETAVREALRDGHAYVSFDWLGDPTGFAFAAVNNLGVFGMGDAAPLAGTTRLTALTPLPAKLKLICNGQLVHEATGTNLTFEAKDQGFYRLEAWLSVDGEDQPWIYANPVRVRAPTLADMSLPSSATAPEVDVRKDLTYVEGAAEDAAKHKLDLYIPKGKTPAPVFFFIHGGAWRYGDRTQYPPLGNRYAKEGFLTVVPSYRLAPKHPHPAQIEDVAAAFAWMVQHIGEYGGDTNRIFLGGHSAGGHLAALLTLRASHLQRYGLSPRMLRGTLALSGVYDLTAFESQSSVFGSDPAVRREASPLFHLQAGAPPFLVTYCQWDYPTLPAQAKRLHAALQRAGMASERVYVPGENHISEMLSVTKTNDVTVAAALQFMRR